jgi:hypothetical protein
MGCNVICWCMCTNKGHLFFIILNIYHVLVVRTFKILSSSYFEVQNIIVDYSHLIAQ